jgi:nucleotide-binding universal stress UspA family protein
VNRGNPPCFGLFSELIMRV